MGYTARHLHHERIVEHKTLVIRKHFMAGDIIRAMYESFVGGATKMSGQAARENSSLLPPQLSRGFVAHEFCANKTASYAGGNLIVSYMRCYS